MTPRPSSPDVIDVKPLDHYRLALTFQNGEKGVFDCSEYLEFGVFQELKDEQYFRRVSLFPEVGTICWPHGQDLCPDSLYVGSVKQEIDR